MSHKDRLQVRGDREQVADYQEDTEIVEFVAKMFHSMRMPEPPPKPQPPKDEWGTTTRQGYEDRPFYQPPRQAPPRRKGSRVLRVIGGLLVVAGIFWATYIATSTGGWGDLLKRGLPSRPVLVLAVGLLVLLLEKLFR